MSYDMLSASQRTRGLDNIAQSYLKARESMEPKEKLTVQGQSLRNSGITGTSARVQRLESLEF
jgi:hypothetical protein